MTPWRIYYALAIVEYLDRKGSPCLADDIVNDYSVHGFIDFYGTLLADLSLLNEAIRLLELVGTIHVEADGLAPQIIESKYPLTASSGLFSADEREIIARFQRAGNRQKNWLQAALKKLSTQRQTTNVASTNSTLQPDLIPGSDRFVRLDDNSSSYQEAIDSLEQLVQEVSSIRINDWEEKDGILASLTAALSMIKSKYVNKTTVLAAVSSAVAFIALKFAEAPINDVANRAWSAIKSLIP